MSPTWIGINREEKPASRDVVRFFLSALANRTAHEAPVLSKDLERLSRVLRSIRQAVEDDVLTESEADAVIGFIGERFTSRRFEEMLDKVTKPKSGAWFVLHSHLREE